MKNKILILILLFFLSLVSCETVEYITPSLPVFNPVRPQKPLLEEVTEDVPTGAVINTIRLMEYSKQLEVYSNSWENYYNELQKEFIFDA